MADRTQDTRRTSGNGRGEGHHQTYGTEERADEGARREPGRLYRAAQDRSEASRREDPMLGMGYARGSEYGRDRGHVYEDEEHRWRPRRDFREESRSEGYYARPRFEGGPESRRQGMEDYGYPTISQGREVRDRLGDRGFEGRDERYAGRSGTGYRPEMEPTGPRYTPPEEEWERAHYGYRDRAEDRRRREFWERESLEVSEVMTRNPRSVGPDATLKEVARVMHDEDTGIVPVIDGTRRVLGLITDRDMVMRTYDQDVPWTGLRARDVMTDDVWAVTPDDKVHHVVELMGKKQVRRIPVVDRNDRLVGMISTADVATRAHQDEELQHALERISRRRTFWSRMWH